MLICDGASLVRHAADVIEILGARIPRQPIQPQLNLPERTSVPTPKRSLRETASLHLQILLRLGPSAIAEDQLIRDLQTTPSKVAPVLIDLRLKGQILRQPGGLVSRLG
jgi:DNA processing protein